MKIIVTLGIYRDSSEFSLPDSAICRHYCVECSDHFVKLECNVFDFAIQSAISYAHDEYYFEEGWKDVVIKYLNHCIADTSPCICTVTPCTPSGKLMHYLGSRHYSDVPYSSNYVRNNKKTR